MTTMSTVRVYDLATKFRLTTKEVLDRLQAAGVDASTFSSTVEEHVALEILSKPLAKIPAQTIRPGAAAPAKPKSATRRTTKVKAASAATPDAVAAPAKPRRRARAAASPTAEEAKAEAKPRTRKAPAAAARAAASKPLVVTLEAPTLEHSVVAPPPETLVPAAAAPVEATALWAVPAPAAPVEPRRPRRSRPLRWKPGP